MIHFEVIPFHTFVWKLVSRDMFLTKTLYVTSQYCITKYSILKPSYILRPVTVTTTETISAKKMYGNIICI